MFINHYTSSSDMKIERRRGRRRFLLNKLLHFQLFKEFQCWCWGRCRCWCRKKIWYHHSSNFKSNSDDDNHHNHCYCHRFPPKKIVILVEIRLLELKTLHIHPIRITIKVSYSFILF